MADGQKGKRGGDRAQFLHLLLVSFSKIKGSPESSFGERSLSN